ncbi:hypothetical protein FRC07_015148, partial [Ceratobasidium sp. 392]
MGIAKRKDAALRNLALAASAKRQKTAERVANTTAADNTVANQNPGERSILVEADVQYTPQTTLSAASDLVPEIPSDVLIDTPMFIEAEFCRQQA